MDKVIVITGAGGILCSDFAKYLAKKGAKVPLLDHNEVAAKAHADAIVADGGIAKAYKCNCLEKESIEACHEAILKDLGPCDILINGAGGNSPRCTTLHEEYEKGDENVDEFTTFFNLQEQGFDFVFDLNMKGTLLPSQVFMKDMIGRSGCCVLNVSSMNAYRPLTKIPAYSAAKAAITNFTSWLAVHFAKENIRVNAIAPGFFVTNQNRALLFDENGNPTKRSEKILRSTPMGRFGESHELLGTVEWLLDETKSGFVTGITVPIDGGFSVYSGV